MSDYEEDIFFDEEEKKERAGAEVSEDDFDDVSDDMMPGKEKNARYQSIVDVEEDEFRNDYDLEEDPDMEDFADLDEVEEIEELEEESADHIALESAPSKPQEHFIDLREVTGEDPVRAEDAQIVERKETQADDAAAEDETEEEIEIDEESDEESDDESDGNGDDHEQVCFMCRRTERVTGKMFKLPNNICVCNDCMHKTMDTVSQFDYQGMLDPAMLDMTMEMDPSQLKDLSKKFPKISFVNLADLRGDGGIPNKQKLKKKKKDAKPALDIKNIPAPHKIKEKLDDYVVGQDYAKKVISVAVYNHYKRVATSTMDEIEIEKSNMLMIGPTGCGKTYLVKTLAKLLDVPLAITDATSLTEAGYIGDDIESVVSKLLAAADNDVERAEMGIIFIDEIDKIAKKKETTSRDVSGESVQQGMLKLLEGAEVEVPVGANSKNAMVPLTTINTRNILFICGGAFPDLDEIIKQRLTKTTSIGYGAQLKDEFDNEKNITKKVTVEDLKKFGMIPEFLGRLPIIYTLDALDKEMYVKILKEPKNAILKQYQKLLALDEVNLQFDDGAIEAIAEKAMEKDTGARALRAIIEEFMLDIMYEIPKDDNIGRVTITKEYIEGTGGPRIEIRSGDMPRLCTQKEQPEDRNQDT